jgi:hypothetical protein
MNCVQRFVLPALEGAEPSEDVSRYVGLFETAVKREIPPYFQAFYGESFRMHVENPIWVIQSLVSNAIKEGEGSRDLAIVADECENASLTSDLAVHIKDEAKHCRMYLGLIQIVFPDALPPDAKEKIRSTFPEVDYKASSAKKLSLWKMLDYLIQINLGEVRTRIHQKLLEPVLCAYCPPDNRGALSNTLCKLAGDECCHIKYTAARIGALSREFLANDVEALFCQRFLEFNRYTDKELGKQRRGMPAAALIRER